MRRTHAPDSGNRHPSRVAGLSEVRAAHSLRGRRKQRDTRTLRDARLLGVEEAVIRYHGGPLTPNDVAVKLWTGRHACVSFAYPQQIALAFEVAQSVMLDNGAYTYWQQGGALDVDEYARFVREWCRHPGFAFCIAPDAIEGDELDNNQLLADWHARGLPGVPVWHMHESLDRLERLTRTHRRVALGSSGAFATIGTTDWWERIASAMAAACDDQGRPRCKLHGLRMLSPTIFSHVPLSSADSTNVARNVGIDKAWKGPYRPVTSAMRALVLAERIEHHVAAARWNAAAFGTQHNLELIG